MKEGTVIGIERAVGIGNTSIVAGTIDRARHVEAKIVGTVANIIATGEGQDRGRGRRIISIAAEEIARAHLPEGTTERTIEGMIEGMIAETIAETFVIVTITGGAIALLPGKNLMVLKPAKVQRIVWPVCRQRQPHWKSSGLSESDNKQSRMQRKRKSTSRIWMGDDGLFPTFVVKPQIWI